MKKENAILFASLLSLSACTPKADDSPSSFDSVKTYDDSKNIAQVSKLNNEIAHKFTKINTDTVDKTYTIMNLWKNCNYSYVTPIESKEIYTVTAKHCFNESDNLENDIIGIKHQNWKKVWFAISNKSLVTAQEDIFHIIGCINNTLDNSEVCYQIEGNIYTGPEDNKWYMYISTKDQDDILSSAGSFHTNLKGFSGSPVFDNTNKLFGVLVENTHLQEWKNIMTLKIQPIRDKDNNLLINKQDILPIMKSFFDSISLPKSIKYKKK